MALYPYDLNNFFKDQLKLILLQTIIYKYQNNLFLNYFLFFLIIFFLNQFQQHPF